MIPDDLHAAEWKQRAVKAEAMALRLDAALRECGVQVQKEMQRAIDATARHAEFRRVAAEKLEAAEERAADLEAEIAGLRRMLKILW